MKKFFTTLVLAGAAMTLPAAAEVTLPESYDGFYRLTNAAFQEALTSKSSYNLGGALPDPANVGSVFQLTTEKMWSFADEMAKLEELKNQGAINDEQYFQLFMNLMNVSSWKSGFYPITRFEAQGEDYIKVVNRFPDWADAAIENFLNNDIPSIYEENRGMLLMLCAFATDIIKPVNVESEENFRKWAESYLTKWRSVADFNLYLHPVYSTPNPDSEDPSEPTGEIYLQFMTPMYVGSMQKAQTYINNVLTSNGTVTDVDTLNIWNSAKHYMLEEMQKEYAEGTPVFNFVHNLLGDSKMNMQYIIGESEEGGLRIQELPDAFNSQNVHLTADDIARCTWKLEEVTSTQPLAVAPMTGSKDSGDYYYTSTNLPFSAVVLSSGMEAFIATEIDPETGSPVLEKIPGDEIPANTPVIIRSASAELSDNCLLPLDKEGEAVSGNILKGTIFETEVPVFCHILGESDHNPSFTKKVDKIPANTAYYDGEITSIEALGDVIGSEVRYFDILGREVKNPTAKGVYIVNGKKIVK